MTRTAAEAPLAGRCAVISGGNRGLGLEIARRYVAAGASVLICARDGALLSEAAAGLRRAAAPAQMVAALAADVSRPEEAQAVIDTALRRLGCLDILVNNAGIVGPGGLLDQTDWAAWVRTVEVNLFGSVLLCRAALPHFKERRRGKIIQISGGGATRPMPMRSAYAASKAAVIRVMETLAEETRDLGIEVNAIAPGALNTRMLDDALAAGPERLGRDAHAALLEQKRGGGVPLAKGADLAVFLGSAASDGITGRLLSAVWDRWRDLPRRAPELAGTDVYTLRRIRPEDRGLSFEDEP
ncbi:MAG TPA: SDR family oxidoreductase [Steroidobacteraceae bacterium]|nr:SDR family oxidoreductase [Steroidobacteraceae bacterium]